MAGSETTATALACITYYLQKNPDILHTLQQEIRTSFESYEQINDASTTPLEYLKAVILEGMRMYPPLPFPLPRVVPSEGGIVDGHFVPGGVSVPVFPFSVISFSSLWIAAYEHTDLRYADHCLNEPICSLHVNGELPRSMAI